MGGLTFEGVSVEIAPGETILEALRAAGVDLPSRCRAGVCQTCLVQVIEGKVPGSAQQGLPATLKAQGYALACVGIPDGPTKIVRAGGVHRHVHATVVSLERLRPDVLRLCLVAEAPFPYRSGQFLALEATDGTIRNYSIASRSLNDPFLELHIRVLSGGQMSRFLVEDVSPGDSLRIGGPFGSCFYEGIERDQPLVLVGTGTGLAPLWGILRDALMRGHEGPIRLYHGARDVCGLYLGEQIKDLSAKHPNLSYRACVSNEATGGRGDLAAHVLDTEEQPASSHFFLCGAPDLVRSLKKALFLRGAKLDRIRADAFVAAEFLVS